MGQHQLIDRKYLMQILSEVDISKNDIVFELGTGHGSLTEELCQHAKKVISCELDRELFDGALSRLSRFQNLELIQDDGFGLEKKYDVFVSNLPFSKSSRFIYWSIREYFRKAVISVQKEFAEKLVAKPNARNYRAISVIAQTAFHIEIGGEIPRTAFSPPPHVQSTIVVLKPRRDYRLDDNVVLWVKKLFSFRGRKLSAAIRGFTKDTPQSDQVVRGIERTLLDRRIEKLDVDEVIKIACGLSEIMKEMKTQDV